MSSESTGGRDFYNRAVLAGYDWWVHDLSDRRLWGCPKELMLQQYNDNVSNVHLDIGVGTGFFLEQCQFPVANPDITIVDIEAQPLIHTAKRIAPYNPTVVQADVYALPDFGKRFGSIGINYLLHCLPGAEKKWQVPKELANLLEDDGVLFGATVLGKDVALSKAQRLALYGYNRSGHFHNWTDSEADLRQSLETAFEEVDVDVQGIVALFTAHKPRRAKPSPLEAWTGS